MSSKSSEVHIHKLSLETKIISEQEISHLEQEKAPLYVLSTREKETILHHLPTAIRTQLKTYQNEKEAANKISTELKKLNEDLKPAHHKLLTEILTRIKALKKALRTHASSLQSIGTKESEQGNHDKGLDTLKQSLFIYQLLFGEEDFLVGIVICNIGNTYISWGKYQAAERCFKTCLEIYKKSSGIESRYLVNARNGLGNALLGQGNFDDALTHYQEARKLLLQQYKKEDQNQSTLLALILNNLAYLYSKTDKLDESLKAYFEVLEIKKSMNSPQSLEAALVMNCIGCIYREKSKFELALKFHQDALQIYKIPGKPASIQVAMTLEYLGLVYSKMQEFDQAMGHLKDAVKICKQLSNKGGNELANILHNITNVLFEMEQFDEATKFNEQALEIRIRLHGPESREAMESYFNQANIYSSKDKHQDAIDLYQKILNILKTTYKEDSTQIARTEINIANAYSMQDNNKLALEFYNRAYRSFCKLYGSDSFQVTDILMNIGTIYLKMTKTTEAHNFINSAITIHLSQPSHTHTPDKQRVLAMLYNTQGMILHEQGKYEEGLESLKKALAIEESLPRINLGGLAATLMNMANIFVDQHRIPEAMTCYNKSLVLAETLHGKESSHVAEVLCNISNVLTLHGLHKHALEKLQLAYKISKKTRGEENSDTAMILGSIGTVYAALKEYDKAHEYCKKTADIFKKLFGDEHDAVATAQSNLGTLHSNQKLHEKSIPFFKDALMIRRKLQGMESYETAESLLKLASAHISFADSIANLRADPTSTSQDELVSKFHYQAAALLYEELLSLHYKVIFSKGREFCTYDLIGHNKLLGTLSDTYIKQNLAAKSGTLYLEEARRYRKAFPIIAYYYCHSALSVLPRSEKHARERFESYQLLAEIAKEMHCLDLAIRFMKKALSENKNERAEKLLSEWIREREALLQELEFDIYQLLENCHTSYLNIQVEILQELEIANMLSEPLKNKITEIFIKLNNVLDIAFGRFAESAIYKPNGIKSVPSYFPCCMSQESFMKELKQRHLLAESAESAESKQGTQSKKQKTLDQSYPTALAAILKVQPFYYHSVDLNKTSPDTWKSSWLEKVLAISNGGKHIGLIPQALSGKLTERIAGLNRNQLTILLLYVEPTFYPWTFVPVLKNMVSDSDEKLLEISAEILKILRSKSYIKKASVIHPLALQYLEAYKKTKDDRDSLKFERKFLEQLYEDLPKPYKEFAYQIMVVLLQKACQYSLAELRTDSQVELHSLIQKSLQETRNIVHTLGKIGAYPKKLSHKTAKPKMSVPEHKTAKISIKDAELQYTKPKDTKTLQESDYLKLHQSLSRMIKPYQEAGNLVGAAEHYYRAALEIIDAKPFLTLHYLRKSLALFRLSPTSAESQHKVCLLLSKIYAEQSLWYQACLCLHLTALELPEKESRTLKIQLKSNQNIYNQLIKNIDADICSQLEHCKTSYLKFQLQIFKLKLKPDNQEIRQDIEMGIVDLIIKLRHMLDQAFARFVHSKIYLPNGKWVTIHLKNAIKFYAFSNEKELKRELRRKKIISKDKLKKSLDRDFPQIFDLLLNAQPYKYPSGPSSIPPYSSDVWLNSIIELSNQVKHQGIGHIFSEKDLNQSLKSLDCLLGKSIRETDHIIIMIFGAISDCTHSEFLSRLTPAEKASKIEEEIRIGSPDSEVVDTEASSSAVEDSDEMESRTIRKRAFY